MQSSASDASEEVSVDVNASEVCMGRESIVIAAYAILGRSDMQISRRGLAQRAGVTTATLQRHFKSLSDLRAELRRKGAGTNSAETEVGAIGDAGNDGL